jgi:hypothetical protein
MQGPPEQEIGGIGAALDPDPYVFAASCHSRIIGAELGGITRSNPSDLAGLANIPEQMVGTSPLCLARRQPSLHSGGVNHAGLGFAIPHLLNR